MTFAGTPRTEGAEHAHESPFVMAFPLVVLAILAVVAGAVNLPHPFPNANILASFLTPGAEHEPLLWPIAGTGLGVALLGVLCGTALYRRSPAVDPVTRLPGFLYRCLDHKWYVDDFYEFGVARISVAWAGVVEACLSQYHEPVISYNWKIGLGISELILLALFLGRSGAGAGGGERDER